MIIKKILNKETSTKIQISSFIKAGRPSEYMFIIKPVNNKYTFEKQLGNIISSYRMLKKEETPEAETVFVRAFLSDAVNQSKLVDACFESSDFAVSIVEQPPLGGSKISVLVYLQTDVKVKKLDNHLFQVKHKGTIDFWSTLNTYNAEDSEKEMYHLFQNYIKQLKQEGCTLAQNCIRTWLYVQNIDANYTGVVNARNDIFDQENLTCDTHAIASTGIQGRDKNYNHRVLMDSYAVKGIKKDQIQYLYATEYLSPTNIYGVRFERGTCINYTDRKHIFISGTASIDKKGNVLYLGDIKNQTLRMWKNVESLLNEAEASFDDVAQISVYLRDISDYSVVKEMFDKKFPATPYLILYAPVCRPEWLIEMECMAIAPNNF